MASMAPSLAPVSLTLLRKGTSLSKTISMTCEVHKVLKVPSTREDI